MASARVYLDEDVYFALARGLRRRGFDVLTTLEAGRTGTSDEEQLEYASTAGRLIFTFNRGDFAVLHERFLTEGQYHAGIVLSRQVAIGPIVRALSRLLATRETDDLVDRLIWLSVGG